MLRKLTNYAEGVRNIPIEWDLWRWKHARKFNKVLSPTGGYVCPNCGHFSFSGSIRVCS